MNKVVIINYGLGNIQSITNACRAIEDDVIVSNDPKIILEAELLILPGVGAFPKAMENLENSKLTEIIKIKANKGHLILGICLGFQLLFESSNENFHCKGLSLIEGNVEKLPSNLTVPNMGWKKVHFRNFEEIFSNEYYYFIHSFYAKPKNNLDILCTSNYGGFEFCTGVRNKNIIGLQFHPEKSGPKGLELLKSLIKNGK